jgi:hypothetical protein
VEAYTKHELRAQKDKGFLLRLFKWVAIIFLTIWLAPTFLYGVLLVWGAYSCGGFACNN